jgi:predicted aspartyl protease
VRLPYMAITAKNPVPSLDGALVRYRPIAAVRLTGPTNSKIRDGLLDSGADDTVFSEELAEQLGIDLTHADERLMSLAGRPKPVRIKYARVDLRISDGIGAYEWSAVIGFVRAKLHYNLLGQAGFLQYFNAEYRGADREVILLANSSFTGKHV